MDTPLDGLNAWKYRKEMLSSLLLKEACDIIGIQEALYSQILDLKSLLKNENGKLEYECVMGPSEYYDSSRKEWIGTHNPIFYNKKKVKLMKNGHFWLSNEPSIPGSKGWDAVCPRVCNWCQFQTIESEEVKINFFVFNTQFDQGIAARRNSSFIMRDFIENLTSSYENEESIKQTISPTIVMGNFNCHIKSNCYSVLVQGIDASSNKNVDSESESDDDEEEAFKLVNCVERYVQENKIEENIPETFTGFKDGCTRTGPINGQPTTVDYILVSSNVRVDHAKVIDNVVGEERRRISTHRPVVVHLML
jgi:endonuclease/exonuclease/phosphatase family metal-dependent hydrolase